MGFDVLPKDPMMLLSVVNTKLRDSYESLGVLCEDLNVDEDTLRETLKGIGYVYDSEQNRFL